MDELEKLRQAIAALETQRDVLGDDVVDASIATLQDQMVESETISQQEATPNKTNVDVESNAGKIPERLAIEGSVISGKVSAGGDIVGRDKLTFVVESSRGLSPFVTAHSFFSRFERPGRLFNHTWALVGRQSYIQQLNDEFLAPDQKLVAILSGRGGIGKTKLLHAFSRDFEEHHPDINLYFVVENVPLSIESVADLPGSPCLIVLDDAHRNEDALKILLAIAERRDRHMTKLLLSSRPQGVDQIKSLLTRTGYDPREILLLEQLGNLEKDDVLELAHSALETEDEYLIEQLAIATRDCPLVTVVGGQLLAQKAIPPNLLERDVEFQMAVLSRFQEEIVGEIEDVDSRLVRRLLALIAALSPIQPMTQDFQQAASEFLGVPSSDLIDTIAKLEKSGILIRRGYAFRIAPDVLSDHILHEACFTSDGFSTGYAQQVFNHFASWYPSQVLRNLAELDWRVLRTTGEPPNLLTGIWQNLLEEFREASNAGRCNALRILKDVAYYQPGPMLRLVEVAIREPATAQDPESVSRLYTYTHANVLSDLPEILRLIGFTLDFLPRCCDLLWELGRDDGREMHPHPYHAMRILTELASYDIDKPVTMNQIVLEAAARWLQQPNVHSHAHHPLDVIDPLLAKSGEATRSYSDRITFHPFAVSLENTRHLRERALQFVVDCARSDHLRAVIRAIDSLESAMRGPFSLHGRQVSDEERERWIPERMQALNHVAAIASRTDDPIIHWRIIEVLRRYIRIAPSDEFKKLLEKTVASIPETFELRLMRTLCANAVWDWVEMPDDRRDRDTAWREYEQTMAILRQNVVQEFVEKHPVPAQGFATLNEFLPLLEDYGFRPSDRQLLATMANHFPEYIIEMSSELVENPDCYLVLRFDLLLSSVRDYDELHGVELAKKAIAVGNNELALALGRAYRWGRFWAKEPSPADLEIFNQLVNHPNLQVRQNAIGSLQNLGNVKPGLALSLMHGIDISNDQTLATELVQIFDDGRWGISYKNLSEKDILAVLEKLEGINEIEDYHINIFLQYASRRLPTATFQFLLRRIKRVGDFSINYQPIPSTGFNYTLDGLINSTNYAAMLREVRDTFLDSSDGVRNWLPRLFKELSPSFHPISLAILQEWVDSEEREKIVPAILLLEEAPEDFIFEHEDFVIYVIERAHAAGGDCYAQVAFALSHSVRFGLRSGAHGQPFPQDVTLRDKAMEARKQYSLGSLGYQFYDELAQWAENRIRDAQLEDYDW